MNSQEKLLDKNRGMALRIAISVLAGLIAAFLTYPSGSAGHCGSSGAGECTIYPVNAIGLSTVEWVWIPVGLIVGVLVFLIIGWWRRFSNHGDREE